ncbi:zinc chelation protein SecC [Neisseria meningitidis]|nr:zinc chelation protein SecC [Neisseria meningitidis]MBG8711354.1 zinc chelation protein SecC [Neisseria meningitidis]MBG8755121.1 zinc chelation protein SecC [Neisseria meningitidis]MBG8770828.1 zinc chelation protein SecC [Neisseria meningitidis]MBJ7764894.1 zinc chelation protein SecC [Neisseria meningitidis]
MYCLRLRRLVLIFVNPLYCPFGRESLKKNFPVRWPAA